MDTDLFKSSNKASPSNQSGSKTKRIRRGMRDTQIVLPNDPPLSEELLLNFSEEAVRTCLYLIDQVGFTNPLIH